MEEANEKMKNYQDQIEDLLKRIEKEVDKNEKKNLYERLLELDDVKEDYSFSYLKFLYNEMKEEYEKKISKLIIGISDNKLNELGISNRKNSKTKIIEYIYFLKDSKLSKTEDKLKFYFNILTLIKNEKNIEFETKKEITWENEELYLFNLYIFLLDSINKKMVENSNEEKIDVTNEFDEYITKLQIFLNDIHQNFITRFKNFELKNMDDKTLFEDYIQFLGTYDFTTEIGQYTILWKETFVPLTQEQKINSISTVNNNIITIPTYPDHSRKFYYNPTLSEIKIENSRYFKEEITIKDIDNYAFIPLVEELSKSQNNFEIDWSKNKWIKPMNHKGCLFVCLKRNIWEKLLIDILNSNAYKEARNKLSKTYQINFFSLKELVTKIIDNICFISYQTSFFGVTRKNTLKLYEKGLFNKQIYKKSIALLKFYAFIIVVNIHEIGGHINYKLQYYYNSKDFQHSPNIHNFKDIEDKFTRNGKSREKESGETIEILLFGKVLNLLTVKESLYVLNLDNYSQSLENFKNNFQQCEKKSIKNLLSNDSLKSLLKNLDIIPEEITELDNIKYGNIKSIKKDDSEDSLEPEAKHPLSFYLKNSVGIELLKKLACVEKDNVKD